MGHSQGWDTALRRLRDEASAAGANAVLDVKMRTIPLGIESSMDFTLVGTAVKFNGLPPSSDPIVATVPALEFVKLLEADVVPIGIAIGAHYEWMNDWRGTARQTWMGNVESHSSPVCGNWSANGPMLSSGKARNHKATVSWRMSISAKFSRLREQTTPKDISLATSC